MMKKRYFALIALLAFALAACEDKPVPTPEPDPDPEPEKHVLVAPSNLQVEVSDGITAVLTWENESTDYDGVEIQKAGPNGKYKMLGNIAAGVFSYTDSEFTENGRYSFRMCSFKGNTYTDYSSVDFTIDGIPEPKPEVRIDKIETASNMIVVRYTITDDYGGSVENGIEWGDGESFTFWKKLRENGTGLGVIINPDGPVTLRAFARSVSDGAIGYSEPQTVSPAPEPEPYNVTYTDITPSDVPSEIKVYKATTTVTGHTVNVWYAIADISTGNVELRTLCPPSNKKTSVWAKSQVGTPYVFTNGGYFYSGQSLSYVMDKGQQKAENDSYLSRTKSYYASRGIFGVTSTGAASVCWRYGGNVGGGPYFYDTPIPQIDGADVLRPSATFPSPAINPGYYNAIGGGPVLVKDGKTRINYYAVDESQSDADKKYLSNFELFYTDIFNKTRVQPRTAIGRTADGKIVLMVVDGRNKGGSYGVVLSDLARLMTGVGCVDVLNLDGGGSSVMCAGQNLTVLNIPSDSSGERAVFSMVGFAKPE